MITYNDNKFFLILFKNVIPYHMEEALRNTIIMTMLSYVIIIANEESDHLNIKITAPWNNTLSVFGFFLFMFIAFRLNSAFAIWSSGIGLIGNLENMSSRLMNNLYSSLLTDNYQNDRQERLDHVFNFKNTLLLYIANIFSMCSGDNGRDDKFRTPFCKSRI